MAVGGVAGEIITRVAPVVGAWTLKGLFATCRRSIVINPHLAERFLVRGEPAIGVTWHRAAIYFLYFFGPYHPAVMISRSRDGEILARFAQRMGVIPVRGSSSRGGREALMTMARWLKNGRVRYAATVADGPRGPRYVAKKGMIALAMMTGLPLLPIMWSAERAWVVRSSWDKTMVPKPFSRVLIGACEPMYFPPEMNADDMELARQELESKLNWLREELDKMTGYKEP